MGRMARHSVIVGAVVLATVALVAGPAGANHSWNGYHWARTANPFTVQLGDNVTSTWDASLSGASTDWSRSTVLDTVVVPGGAKPRSCRPTSGRDEICNSTYGNTGWLGIAQIWITGGVHITQGTVKLNDTYFNSSPYNTSAWRNLVTCQEIGHTFGLAHQDENFNNPNLGTCMDYTNDPSTNQHPNQHDYDELVTIYSHLDSFSTVGSPSAATTNRGSSGRAQAWGRAVARSSDGRSSTYVRDLGSGLKVVTFVIWA
ncbi:MAG TPA: hypothetical protein VGB19_16380 [Actinomycetota bacterium]